MTARGSRAPVLDGESLLVGPLRADAPRHARIPPALAPSHAATQAFDQGADSCLGVRHQVAVRGLAPLLIPGRVGIDLQDVRGREQLAAVDGVVGEASPDCDHKIGVGEDLARRVGREASRDAEIERMVVEQAPRRQGGGQIGAAQLGELDTCVARARADRAAPGDDDDTLGRPDKLRRPLDRLRSRTDGLHRWSKRGGRHVGRPHNRLLLQIHGHAKHDGLPPQAGMQERARDLSEREIGIVDRHVVGAAGLHERQLLDPLVVPSRPERAFAGENDERDLGTHGGRESRHDLREAWAAGHRGDPHLGCRVGIAHGHGAGAMLVPHVERPGAELGQAACPVHVAVAQQGEMLGDALRRERLRERFVKLGALLFHAKPRPINRFTDPLPRLDPSALVESARSLSTTAKPRSAMPCRRASPREEREQRQARWRLSSGPFAG